jgi:plastocyanin
MRRPRISVQSALIAVLVALIAACTSSSVAPAASTVPISASVVPSASAVSSVRASATIAPICANPCAVAMVDRLYKPKRLTINVGTEVIWTNVACEGGCTVTFEPEVGLDSGHMAIGATFTHTFNTPGIFRFHCQLDPAEMVGYLTVTG